MLSRRIIPPVVVVASLKEAGDDATYSALRRGGPRRAVMQPAVHCLTACPTAAAELTDAVITHCLIIAARA